MNRRKENEKEIAKERIERLFKLAREVFHTDRNLSKRYLDLAKKIGMKCGVRIPREYKQFICKGCGNLLVPGVNCRVRVRPEGGTRVVVTCLVCQSKKRYPATMKNITR